MPDLCPLAIHLAIPELHLDESDWLQLSWLDQRCHRVFGSPLALDRLRSAVERFHLAALPSPPAAGFPEAELW
eukprot:5068460-Pyramimonas_sp.AAC.1